ncbi:MAG: hypothetical protein SVW57_10860, partial [Thermodesulfobacteriota bacterium]|nr:hypothetical protein [Thermodesulfobacteriota bacterium]
MFVVHVSNIDAALVGQEPFDYQSGVALHGQGGGTFPDTWVDNAYWIPGFSASNGGLTYPGLAVSGNAALGIGSGSNYRLNRPIGQEWHYNVDDEMWISFLLQVDDATPQSDEFVGIVLAKPSVVGSVYIGMYDSRNIGFNVQEHDNIYATHYEGINDDAITVGQTHLILAHLVFNGDNMADSLDLWVDPVIGDPLGTPNDSYSGARMILS